MDHEFYVRKEQLERLARACAPVYEYKKTYNSRFREKSDCIRIEMFKYKVFEKVKKELDIIYEIEEIHEQLMLYTTTKKQRTKSRIIQDNSSENELKFDDTNYIDLIGIMI